MTPTLRPLVLGLPAGHAGLRQPDATGHRRRRGTADPSPTSTLQTVVVSGLQPGPGLWQVRKGDHVLWIMATLRPLPRRLEWEPRQLDDLVRQADHVITPPGLRVDADVGFFGSLGLLPTALRARNNPDDQELVDVLPPELYARWQVQKARYMGRDRGVERRRPFIAAFALMDEAMEDLDLSERDLVWRRVSREAERHDRTFVTGSYEVKVSDPKQALRDFSASPLDDTACMAATLSRLETDTDAMVERANAWAYGEIDTLRAMPFDSEIRACVMALMGSEALRSRGFDGLPAKVVQTWVDRASESLEQVPLSVGVVDFQVLTNPDGILAALRAKGYEVIEPVQPGTLPPPADDGTAEPVTTGASEEATPTPVPQG